MIIYLSIYIVDIRNVHMAVELTCAVTCLLLHFITFHVAFQHAISSLRR